ncbi:MAG TPA: HlyD family secretion protein [Bryobacteraceae bacterium]|jgi:membrane fusion protein (multidrug efflux system)
MPVERGTENRGQGIETPEEERELKQEHPEDEANKTQEEEGQKKPHPLRKWLIIAGAAIGIVGAVIWWLHSRQFESTDDAFVDGHISGISSRIAGTVVGVYVEENDSVKAGQTLVDLDPRDNKVAVEQARSQLNAAEAAIKAEQPNVPVTEVTNETGIATAQADVEAAQAGLGAAERDHDAALARVRESEATNTKAQADVERYRPLAEKDEIPREQFDQVMATAKAQAATVAANQAAAEASLRQVDQKRAQVSHAQQRLQEAMKNAPNQVAIQAANVAGRRSSAEAARAQLDQALLNLSYSKIASPVDGIVAKRMAEVGDHVSPGQQLLLVAQIQDLWVTANFKETQIRRIHPGQSVRIHVDSLGRDFDGYVESMPAASGSVTSLLPPENATGNFVKVVQRLPVRIEFKKGQAGMDRLRPGMSVEPKVRVE